MHPPRAPSFSYVGLHRYFLTICTAGRSRTFTSHLVVDPVLMQFRLSASAAGFQIDAYCFMPDHFHTLCTGLSDRADFRAYVADAKQKSGFFFGDRGRQRLWQKGYYDHVLRDEEPTLSVVRYIFDNPLRKGLSRRFGEYPFCGSDAFSIQAIAECLQSWTPPWQI
jgi:putative transposase